MTSHSSSEPALARLWDFARRAKIKWSLLSGSAYLFFLRRTGRIYAASGVIFQGVPLIDVRAGARISLGAGSSLNSLNLGYHLGMPAPVKLMADRPESEIVIGENSRIHGSCIHAQDRITIGDRCLVAANCQIMDNSGHDLAGHAPHDRIHTQGSTARVVIEDDVWLATGVIVLPGARIGRGSVIAAGSVVAGVIPPMSLAGGIPCRVLRNIADME